MTRLRLLILLVPCVAISSCAGTDPWREAQQRQAESRALAIETGVVYGTLSDSATGNPVAAANVIVPGARVETQSDERGHYEIARLPAGPNLIRAVPNDADPWRAERRDTAIVIARARTRLDMRLPERIAPWADSAFVGLDVPDAARFLRCDLRLTKSRYRVGERPQFVSRISYSGPDSIYLASAFWGFHGSQRRPRAWLTLNGPGCGANLANDAIIVDSSRPHIDETDFYVLHTDEFVYGALNSAGDTVLTSNVYFPCPGQYQVEFHYRADSPAARAWIRCDPGSPRPSPTLLAFLSRAPLVDLVATQKVRVDP